MSLEGLDHVKMREIKAAVRAQKEATYKQELEELQEVLDLKSRRLIEAAREKGASSWLSALPIKRLGYAVNKQEFRDAIALRYGWSIHGMPKHCGCGQLNSVDHAMTCGNGGYVIMRHNAIRDTEAKLMKEVCKDVVVEPGLIPTVAEMTDNAVDGARLDVAARGMWSACEKTFYDVVIAYPNAQSHINKPLNKIYKEKEQFKKGKYNDRIINVEKSSFVPLVFTTTGGMGPECERLHKRMAELIAAKRSENYSQVMQHVRCRLRFALLKATLVAIRGVRGSSNKGTAEEEEIGEISYNLIPTMPAYEP